MTVKKALKDFNLPFKYLHIKDSKLYGGQTLYFDFTYPLDTHAYKEWLEDYGDSDLICLFYNPSECCLNITI